MHKFTIVLILTILSVYTLNSQEIRLLSEHNPPFSFSDQVVYRGIAIELLSDILKDTERKESTAYIEFLPWARSYKIVKETPNTILFPMARTEGRESLFKWVGPIYTLQIGIVARKSADIIIEDFDDLHNYSIGTVRDGAPELLLIEQGLDNEHIDQTVSIESNFKKLIYGRIDLVAYNIPSTFYNLKIMGEDLEDYEVVYIIKEVDLYYALHRDTDRDIIEKWQDSLEHLKESGTYAEIISKYL